MVEFILNNKTIKTAKKGGITLLDFVRYEQRLSGTKIGCREGDCGACTILVGTLKENDTVEYQSITSCISPLGNAQGKHIVTVEGTNLQNKLTTSQIAMKNNYATQCGFCTPGFVVALTGFALSKNKATYSNALDAISGNICRCTGYKSIENAAKDVCYKLEQRNGLQWLIENEFVPEYFTKISKRLRAIQAEKSLQSGVKIVAGGTDLYVQRADDLIDDTVHLILDNESLKGIEIKDNQCTVGAGNTVTDLWNHTALNTYFPKLREHLKLVSSEQIRNMASFGGNLVNASPIGDMTIFFLALNSDIVISSEQGKERMLPLREFYNGYKSYDLIEGELIKNITFRLPSKQTYFNFEKVSKRIHLDIASVNSACKLRIEKNTIIDAHLAIGGVAAIPKYLQGTSDFLKGKMLSPETIIEANSMLQTEISPISDVRGSSDYKRLLARQLFFAHFMELFSEKITLENLVQHA